MSETYDADYFERGIETGKSCFSNYRWMPEMTIPMAMSLVDHLGIHRDEPILDVGCAKGYLVKALRLLHREAYGCDVSEYALAHAPEDVRPHLFRAGNGGGPAGYVWAIAKDVFEHVPEPELRTMLKELSRKAAYLFTVVPLGDGKRYVVPAYELDVTHVHRQPLSWWNDLFLESGWNISEFKFRVPGVKDSWAHYATGNGFWLLRSNAGKEEG